MKSNMEVIPKPVITVIGVGGSGGNAVQNMIQSNLLGVNFVVANTDAQALERCLAERKVQLGARTTRGLGAGADPKIGKSAAEESIEEIRQCLLHSDMVFITAGMGGGTGTGAAPVFAEVARGLGILTVGVVTTPFHFEGARRMHIADEGLKSMRGAVDALIIIPNQNLFKVANENTTFADAFKMADEVLHGGVRSITDLVTMPGLINLDFADVRTVMSNMGIAVMGTGVASGADRAVLAAQHATSNPILGHSIKGAQQVLINVTGGPDMTLFEVNTAVTKVREAICGEHENAKETNIIFGSTLNPDEQEGRIWVAVVATGINDGKEEPRIIEKAKPVEEDISLAKQKRLIELTEVQEHSGSGRTLHQDIYNIPALFRRKKGE